MFEVQRCMSLRLLHEVCVEVNFMTLWKVIFQGKYYKCSFSVSFFTLTDNYKLLKVHWVVQKHSLLFLVYDVYHGHSS